jgi:cell division protein FtsB
MKNSKKRKKRLIFYLVICCFFGAIFVRQQFTIYKLNSEYKNYEAQLDKLNTRKAELNEKYKLTQREDYVEKLAREKLGLIKPGEILFIDKNKVK